MGSPNVSTIHLQGTINILRKYHLNSSGSCWLMFHSTLTGCQNDSSAEVNPEHLISISSLWLAALQVINAMLHIRQKEMIYALLKHDLLQLS